MKISLIIRGSNSKNLIASFIISIHKMGFYTLVTSQSLLIPFLALQVFISSEASDFGKPCRTPSGISEDHFCGFGESSCIDQECQCRVPSMMSYSRRLDSCGAPVGSHCDQNITCFSGSLCSSDNICTCPDSAEVLSDGTCSASRYDPCLEDADCNSNDFLACYEGRCDCKSSRRTFYQHASWADGEHFEGGCRIRAGEACLSKDAKDMGPIQPCTLHAECNVPENTSVPISNSVFSRTDLSMMMGQCLCQAGHTPTPEGTCRKDYGTSCTTTLEECNSNAGLMCKDNTCVCIDDDTMYDKGQRACVSFAGESCGEFPLWYESYDIGCIQNAECVLNPGRVLSTAVMNYGHGMGKPRSCKCKTGFQESMEEEGRTCVPVSVTM